MRLIIHFLILVSLVSCAAAPQKQLSREEWISLTSRTYPDTSKDQALLAVEKLFRLADGDDFKIIHTEDGLQASRQWTSYAVIAAVSGTDYWNVKAIEKNGSVTVVISASTQSQNTTPIPTTGGNWTAGTLGAQGNLVDGTAIYDVFWARLDYLLGKRADWMLCKEADERVKQKITWGNNEALCNSFNMKDSKPN